LAFIIRYLADVPGQIFRAIFIVAAVSILLILCLIIIHLFVEIMREAQLVC